MQGILVFILGALSVAEPFLSVNWATPEKRGVSIVVPGLRGAVQECLADGNQARIRFEFRLCRRRSAWLDRCEHSRSELHTAEYDGITESYRVVSDRFGDVSEATAVGIPSREDAAELVLHAENLSLPFLVRDDEALLHHPGAYISVRTIFRCKGASSRTFAHLSRFLTLGLVNVVESTSDWEDFSLLTEATEG